MEARNLRDVDVDVLKKCFDQNVKTDNPEATLRIFDEPHGTADLREAIVHLGSKVDALQSFIKHIFDGHVLINGRFEKI